jgi:hypothetical protein
MSRPVAEYLLDESAVNQVMSKDGQEAAVAMESTASSSAEETFRS